MSSRRSERAFVILALAFTSVSVAPRASAQEPAPASSPDPLRERFKQGLEKYKAQQYREAIDIWESVYAELGPAQGFRVALNLARAHDATGDSTRAAEHFESYLKEVDRRRAAGDALDPDIEKQEEESKRRLADLAATKGRIKVVADDDMSTKVDGVQRIGSWIAYVGEGPHTVTFGKNDDAERQTVRVKIGELVEVKQPPRKPKSADPPPPPPPPPPKVRFETVIERPFSSTFVWIGAGATLLSTIVPIVMYANAGSIKSDYDASTSRSEKQGLASDYDSARSAAYATLAIPIGLGTITAGLGAWYLFGTKETQVPVRVTASASKNGGSVGVGGAF